MLDIAKKIRFASLQQSTSIANPLVLRSRRRRFGDRGSIDRPALRACSGEGDGLWTAESMVKHLLLASGQLSNQVNAHETFVDTRRESVARQCPVRFNMHRSEGTTPLKARDNRVLVVRFCH